MKKALYLVIMAIIACHAFSQKSSNDFVFLASLPISNTSILFDDTLSPMSLFFDKYNNLYLPNGDSDIVTLFTTDFRQRGIYKNDNASLKFFSGPIMSLWDSLVMYGYDWCTYFEINRGTITGIFQKKGIKFDIIIGDLALGYNTGKKQVFGFLDIGNTEGQIKALNNDDLVEYLRENGKKYGITLKGDAILYRGWTWEPNGSNIVWKDRIHATWLAIDKDGLAYSMPDVYSLDGRVIATINSGSSPDPKNKKEWTSTAFDYEGNSYIFCTSDVYYLGRDWGYDTTFAGKVNDSGASLRLHAGALEFKLCTLARNEAVTILEKTVQQECIAGKVASWYKIKRSNGLVGWMFGAYLSLPEGEAGILTYDSPALKLRGL